MAISKTTKKNQTPIDEKETFVSLRKSFAESADLAEKLKVLYDLQQADNAIAKLVQLRGELPEEVNVLETEVEAMKAKVARLEEVIVEYNNTISAAKSDITATEGDMDKYQQQLSNITNSREYDSINKELENLDLLRQIAQKNIREAGEAIEEKKADIERISAALEARQSELETKRGELDGIIATTADEEKVLQTKRDAYAKKIDERTMSAYERIRAKMHNHLAVVPVYNNSCGGCFSEITPQRLIDIASGTKLVICEHCGRILVNADGEKAEE